MPDSTSQFERVWDVPIELTVEVARTAAPLRALLDLRPGTVVPLNRLASEPVELRAGGRILAFGEVIVIDDEFGIRVTELANGVGEAYVDSVEVPEPGAVLDELSAWAAAQSDVPAG